MRVRVLKKEKMMLTEKDLEQCELTPLTKRVLEMAKLVKAGGRITWIRKSRVPLELRRLLGLDAQQFIKELSKKMSERNQQ